MVFRSFPGLTTERALPTCPSTSFPKHHAFGPAHLGEHLGFTFPLSKLAHRTCYDEDKAMRTLNTQPPIFNFFDPFIFSTCLSRNHNHPAHSELVGHHSIQWRPKRFHQWHIHLASFSKRIESGIGGGFGRYRKR